MLQRHHQLLLPALQLALAIANGCGTHSSTAAKQIQSLLLDQREAMKAVLEDATVAPTYVSLQEAQLLVQLMRLVLPILSDQDLVGFSEFVLVSCLADGSGRPLLSDLEGCILRFLA